MVVELRIKSVKKTLTEKPAFIVVNSTDMLREIINVTLFFLLIVKGVCGAEETSVSVTEGDSVILHSDFTETHTDQTIVWRFGDQETRIAEIYKQNPPEYSDDQFRNRLMMDSKTGSLNITNIRTEDAGLYTLMISSIGKSPRYKRFRVSVYDRLPVPIIRNSISSSVCEVVCSVENVRNVTLSWYKGESLISSISVSDLSRRVSLLLEIESLNDSYVCVLNNTITQQNTHLNMAESCPPCQPYLEKKELNLYMMMLLIALPLFLVLCLTMIILIYKKRSSFCKKRSDGGEELDYAEVTFSSVARRVNREPVEETIYSGVMT